MDIGTEEGTLVAVDESVPSTSSDQSHQHEKLEALAAEIKQEVALVVESARKGLQHAKRAGTLLLDAKTLVKHGEWTRWIEANCSIQERSAQQYMQIAEQWNEIESKAQHVADLTINEACKLLAKTKKKPVVSADVPPAASSLDNEGAQSNDKAGSDQLLPNKSWVVPDRASSDDVVEFPAVNVVLKEVHDHPVAEQPEDDELEQMIEFTESVLEEILTEKASVKTWNVERRLRISERLTHLKLLIDEATALLQLDPENLL